MASARSSVALNALYMKEINQNVESSRGSMLSSNSGLSRDSQKYFLQMLLKGGGDKSREDSLNFRRDTA